MKRFYQLSAAVTLLATVGAAVQAQTAVAVVAVNALVSASLAATSPNALSFGTVVQGSAASTIGPDASAAGTVNISGTSGQGITITMTSLPATLAGPSSSTLGVSAYKYCYTQSPSLQASCTATATTSGGTVSGQTLSGGGQGYLYLGATLAAPAVSQTIGAYTASMTITITSP